jgi:hypothetical protein
MTERAVGLAWPGAIKDGAFGPVQPALDATGKRALKFRPSRELRSVREVPLTARLLLQQSLTARRAAGIIAAFTFLVTVLGGILERVLDRPEFPTIGRGLWFALQRSLRSDTET